MYIFDDFKNIFQFFHWTIRFHYISSSDHHFILWRNLNFAMKGVRQGGKVKKEIISDNSNQNLNLKTSKII